MTYSALQLARADFIVNAIRENLPAASIWHDKPYGSGQIDSLTLVSTGGMYSVTAYDRTHPLFQQRDDILLCGNLGLSIHHVAHTHKTLMASDITEIVDGANRVFGSVIADDPQSVTAAFRRVTCLMEFASSKAEVEHEGHQFFERIGNLLNWSGTYYPFSIRETFLPMSEAWNAAENPNEINRSAEFLFATPVPLAQVTEQLRAVAPAADSLLAPGVRTRIEAIPQILATQFIGRCF